MADSTTNLEDLKKLAPPAELQRAPVRRNQSRPGRADGQALGVRRGQNAALVVDVVHPVGILRDGGAAGGLVYKISVGVGVWGNNHPVMWGLDIVNFIWWVGVAHAGTLISALLFLTRQHWRTTIGRAAEAMTVFSVMMAGLYPAIHVGRSWFDWFMFPIPNSERHLAAIPFAADVGRVRREHLPDGLDAVLVHGHDS